MPASLDSPIADWQGGTLTVKRLGWADQKVEAWPLTDETFPKSTGLAFPAGRVPVPVHAVPGVVVDIECRTLVIQAVAIWSRLEDGPELTQSVLRKIGSLRDIVLEAASREALRLHVDENGEVYGVPLGDPLATQLDAQGAGDDAANVVERAVGRVGRPPLSEEHLQEVADVIAEAQALRKPIAKTVAEHFGISEGTAKKRIRIARDRGHWSVWGRPSTRGGGTWTAITGGGED